VAILKTSFFNSWALTCKTSFLAAKAQYVQGGLNETLVLTLNSFSIPCKSVRRCHKPINLQAFLCNIVLIAIQRRARSVAQLNCRLFRRRFFSITDKTSELYFHRVLLVLFAANSEELIFSLHRCLWHFGVACHQPVLLPFGIDWLLNGGGDGSKLCCSFIGDPEP
jgi:hypothetical protein